MRHSSSRLDDLKRFYSLLDQLRARVGGWRRLADCDAKRGWPERAVYFFFEDGEVRSSSGDGPRVVRVGTHALRRDDDTSLWSRLRSHRGVVKSGGGNHRGSRFRLLIGTALMHREPRLAVETWGQGNSAPRDVRRAEHALECQVSDLIRQMPFLWLAIPDEPGPNSLRSVVERNSIALLSNAKARVLDAASSNWLGFDCPRDSVRSSGLWNSHYTEDVHEPAFLDDLERLVVGRTENRPSSSTKKRARVHGLRAGTASDVVRRAVDEILDRALQGIGPLPSAPDLADEYRTHSSYANDTERVRALISGHASRMRRRALWPDSGACSRCRWQFLARS